MVVGRDEVSGVREMGQFLWELLVAIGPRKGGWGV
jgi:hypothetical protein